MVKGCDCVACYPTAKCDCPEPQKQPQMAFEFAMDSKEEEKSGCRKHAEREFVALGYDLDDKEEGPNKWIMDNVFELLDVFGKQGHSGFSAPYCLDIFNRCAKFEPLCPLLGDDKEWNDVSQYGSGEPKYQNNRCSHVFKESNGRAYDSDGIIFRDEDGCTYTSMDSRVYITFPYVPVSKYVDVKNENEENE